MAKAAYAWPPPAAAPSERRPADPPQLLVGEDSLMIAVALRTRLETVGVKIVALAVDGEKALAAARALAPQAVCRDFELPGAIDGVEAARIISNGRRWASPCRS